MKMMLKDAPGAREFINSVIHAAEDVAIAVTGLPDNGVKAMLEVTRANLARDLAPDMGAATAAEFADIFVSTVMGEKHEREQLMSMGIL